MAEVLLRKAKYTHARLKSREKVAWADDWRLEYCKAFYHICMPRNEACCLLLAASWSCGSKVPEYAEGIETGYLETSRSLDSKVKEE